MQVRSEAKSEENDYFRENAKPACPITNAPFVKPVVDRCGHSFEESAISAWLQRTDNFGKCPLDRNTYLCLRDIKPNYDLVKSIAYSTNLESENTQLHSEIEKLQEETQQLKTKLHTANLIQTSLMSTTEMGGNPIVQIDPVSYQFIARTFAVAKTITATQHQQKSYLIAKSLLANVIRKKAGLLKAAYINIKQVKKVEIVNRHAAVQINIKNQVINTMRLFDPMQFASAQSEVRTVANSVNRLSVELSHAIARGRQEIALLRQEYVEKVTSALLNLQKSLFRWHQLDQKTNQLAKSLLLLRQEQVNISAESITKYQSSTAATLKKFGGCKNTSALINKPAREEKCEERYEEQQDDLSNLNQRPLPGRKCK